MTGQIRVIELDDRKVIIESYKPRRTGTNGKTVEVTIPPRAFEREARRRNMTVNEAIKKLRAVWRFNNFHGLYLEFELRKSDKNGEPTPSQDNDGAGRQNHPATHHQKGGS